MVAIGTPRPSVSTWRVLPSLPPSVGLGPTAAAGVRVVGAVAPSPDSHRPLAKPTGCPALARTAAGTPPTDVATPRSPPTAGSGHAPWSPARTPAAGLTTGSPSATHTAPRPRPAGCPSTAVRLWGAPPAARSARRSSIPHLARARSSAAPATLPCACSSSTSRHSLPECSRVIGQILSDAGKYGWMYDAALGRMDVAHRVVWRRVFGTIP